MPALIAAGLQLDIAWEDPPANFARADELAAQAVAAGARLLVLPEMFATGFSMDAERVAEQAGAIRSYLADLAVRHGVWLIGGYAEPGHAEPGDPRPRNACALFDPAGAESLLYHKVHPFSLAGEDRHFAGGTRLPTADVEGVRVTPLICYDLRFPEPFRAAAAETDLFVVIASWPQARRGHWSTLLQARAIENQAFVLGVNRVGEGGGLAYSGDSALIDPLGEVIAAAAAQPAVVRGDVSADVVAQARARFSFLADRRPEVYAAW
jgi:predicted amidohydrolase